MWVGILSDEELSRASDHDRYARHVEGAVRKRRYGQIEVKMVSDFVREYMPAYRCWVRVHVGPKYAGQLEKGRTENEVKALGNWRYYADLVAVGEKDIVLGEFAVRFRADHVGKILGYSYLLPMTPEFMAFHDRTLKLIGVSAQFDPLAVLMCDHLDIELIRFNPHYAEEYLRGLELRKQRPSMSLLPSIARYGESYAKGYRI